MTFAVLNGLNVMGFFICLHHVPLTSSEISQGLFCLILLRHVIWLEQQRESKQRTSNFLWTCRDINCFWIMYFHLHTEERMKVSAWCYDILLELRRQVSRDISRLLAETLAEMLANREVPAAHAHPMSHSSPPAGHFHLSETELMYL